MLKFPSFRLVQLVDVLTGFFVVVALDGHHALLAQHDLSHLSSPFWSVLMTVADEITRCDALVESLC